MRFAYPKSSTPGLQRALERHDPHEGKRWQNDEREGVERGANVSGRGDQAKRDEATAHRGQEHRRRPVDSAIVAG